MVVHKITSMEEFEKAIASPTLAVVDFFAVWCGPCITMTPHVHKMAEDPANLEAQAMFYQVDVDELSDVAAKVGISAMPTFQGFKNGQKVFELVGANLPELMKLVATNRA